MQFLRGNALGAAEQAELSLVLEGGKKPATKKSPKGMNE
jgi:hypothetical protein